MRIPPSLLALFAAAFFLFGVPGVLDVVDTWRRVLTVNGAQWEWWNILMRILGGLGMLRFSRRLWGRFAFRSIIESQPDTVPSVKRIWSNIPAPMKLFIVLPAFPFVFIWAYCGHFRPLLCLFMSDWCVVVVTGARDRGTLLRSQAVLGQV